MIVLITGSVLLLSAAGIHALMSFTVNQRRREIGIRSALGASTRLILTSVLARATRQLALGVGLGLAAAVGLDLASRRRADGRERPAARSRDRRVHARRRPDRGRGPGAPRAERAADRGAAGGVATYSSRSASVG